MKMRKSICQNLQTKSIYIPGGDLQNLAKTNPNSCYWCNLTMQVFGPDDQYVSPDECDQSRSCFESIGMIVVKTDQSRSELA